MIPYLLYRIGHFLALHLPLGFSYFLARVISTLYYYIARNEREAVIENLKIISMNKVTPAEELGCMAKDVFNNFAKYLVDFFRFSKVDREYVQKFIKIEGRQNIDAALANGKGVIMLSAHIGNWELGGAAISLIGYPISAVVLTHQNKKINDFFTRQRMLTNLRPIEIGISLRTCYNVLKNNSLLGLLGDRDFMKNGFRLEFFGRETSIPKGPSAFSYRIGAAIVPSFMLREKDDTFRLVFEKPIFPDLNEAEDVAVKKLTQKYLTVLEDYIGKYPTQWYVFKEFWNGDKKSVHPDTII